MSILTHHQLAWLADHPQYTLCGPPRPGVKFRDCGTLYADGSFDLMAPMKVVRLQDGCRLVGVPAALPPLKRCDNPDNCPYPVCIADGHCESSQPNALAASPLEGS